MKRTIISLVALLSGAVPGFCGQISTVPEPSTDILLGTVIIGFGVVAVYRSRKKKPGKISDE